jgi:ppGpp synthetase/RelA/SpoT-type nucleotidyltranferase
MMDVQRAGEVIAGDLTWTDETAPRIREAFQIANNWRDAHAFPMRSLRAHLIYYMRNQSLHGTSAARLKRMQAIRRKLRRLGYHLNQLQDLGGCRVILPSIGDVHTLVSALRDNSRHDLRGEDNYIASPKDDGYRSHHLMFKFRGRDDSTIHDGRRVEIQIRTRLQHSWATAVEAVGLFRGEDLKADQGSQEWLRLFKLMSAEFAAAERCVEPADVPHHGARVSEIRELDKSLEAAATLENLSHAVRWTDIAITSTKSKPSHYLIKYDNATRQVEVQPYFSPTEAVRSYDSAEFRDNRSGLDTANIVLVEVDKIENLKVAYPNYFGDVQLFKEQLRQITKGKSAQEYTVRPQETIAPRPKENPNFAWLRRRIRWR